MSHMAKHPRRRHSSFFICILLFNLSFLVNNICLYLSLSHKLQRWVLAWCSNVCFRKQTVMASCISLMNFPSYLFSHLIITALVIITVQLCVVSPRAQEVMALRSDKHPCVTLALIASMPKVFEAVQDKCITKANCKKDSKSFYVSYICVVS
jgi:hypothetical protein